MRAFFAALVCASVLCWNAAAKEDKKPDPKADQKNMQGTWTVEKFLRDGKPFPVGKEAQFVIKGNKMSFKVGDREQSVTFTLDPGKKPPAIDLAHPTNPNLKAVGIYRLEKDKLTILRVEADQLPRPKSFDESNKEGTIFWVFKRKSK
jgi:uncharacterized protein (TIGR03067 family)